MSVADSLAALVTRFNRHVERTPALEEELRGLERTIAVDLSDGESYAVDLTGGRLGNLRAGAPKTADLRIRTDPQTFEQLLAKEIGPMKALVTRRLSIEGSLEDKLLLRRLL